MCQKLIQIVKTTENKLFHPIHKIAHKTHNVFFVQLNLFRRYTQLHNEEYQIKHIAYLQRQF